MSEKVGYQGIPEEDWNRLHRIQPGPMPSREEYFSREVRETPDQLELFDVLSRIVRDERFAMTGISNVIMKVGLWTSVESGELTHKQGAELEQMNSSAIHQIAEKLNTPRGE